MTLNDQPITTGENSISKTTLSNQTTGVIDIAPAVHVCEFCSRSVSAAKRNNECGKSDDHSLPLQQSNHNHAHYSHFFPILLVPRNSRKWTAVLVYHD